MLIIFALISLLQAHLEDLAEKDATEKSNAAGEAFLAELALDSKKGTQGRSDISRNTLEKGKDRRKNKEYKKTKELKVSNFSLWLCFMHCRLLHSRQTQSIMQV